MLRIYSSFRRDPKSARAKWSDAFEGSLGAFRRHRGRVFWTGFKKINLGVFCLLAALGGIALFNANRFSFAYHPPLHEGLLIRPAVLASFQSVPTTDPDEYEPDSMDRIEEVVEEMKPAAAALTRKDMVYKKYRIRTGDSVWDIARENGIRSGTLIWANATLIQDPARLPVGKEILIPNMDAIEIKLKAGETIWSVARRFSVNPGEIVKFNALTDAKKLNGGDKLFVPNPNLSLQAIHRAASNRGGEGFVWPSSYRTVNSYFGFRMHPIRKRRIFHEGIDIGGGRGSTVFSAGDGSVSFVGWMRGYGKIIVIRHKNGLTTRYAHLSSTRVFRGQRVEQGQMIGAVGATGLATGPNLHFEIRKNGLPQNPIAYLKRK